MPPKKIFMHALMPYSAANYLSQFIGFFSSVALRRFLGPYQMGMWSTAQVILDYAGQASLGLTRAMARDYPVLKGKGDKVQADAVMNLTFTFTLLATSVPCLALLAYYFWAAAGLTPDFRYVILFLLFQVFLQRGYDFFLTLMRASQLFSALSLIIIFQACWSLILACISVRFWGINGLLWGTCLGQILVLFALISYYRWPIRFFLNMPLLWSELKGSLPLALSAFLITFFRGIDRIWLAKFLGFSSVGFYSIVLLAANYLLSMPMMVSHVWNPRMLQEYGESQENAAVLRESVIKPLYGLLLFFLAAYGVTLAVLPVLVELFLPAYKQGLPLLNIYIPGLYFLMLGQFGSNLLIALKEYWVQVWFILISIAVQIIFLMLGQRLNLGLSGVALAVLVGNSIFGSLIMATAGQKIGEKGWKWFLIPVLVFFSGCFIISCGLNFIHSNSMWVDLVEKLLIVSLVSIGCGVWMEKKIKVVSKLLNSFKKTKTAAV